MPGTNFWAGLIRKLHFGIRHLGSFVKGSLAFLDFCISFGAFILSLSVTRQEFGLDT